MNEGSTRNIYRFTLLKKGADADVLKALALLATKETELVFGRAKRKLETTCRLSPRRETKAGGSSTRSSPIFAAPRWRC